MEQRGKDGEGIKQQPENPVPLFYSYAHEDEILCNTLDKHLILLQYNGFIMTRDHRHIPPGANRSSTIDQHLKEAAVILLLISPDYLASASCYKTEMPQALERHRMGEALVIPVLLRPVEVDATSFAHLQYLPRNGKPVTQWDHQDDAFHEIAKELRSLLENRRATMPPQPQVEAQDRIHEEREARIKYLKYQIERYSTVTLPIGPAEGFSLPAIFQPLRLLKDPLGVEDIAERKRHSWQRKSVEDRQRNAGSNLGEAFWPEEASQDPPVIVENGEEALQKSPYRRVIILGGPGSGKTVTLKHFVADRAKKALVDVTAPLPLYLSLGDLARSGKTLPRYLMDLVEDLGIASIYADVFTQQIESGHAFLCLDGLDEVDPRSRPRMIDLIHIWAARAGNTWIIGSRFTDYKGGQLSRSQFTEWELQPMSHELRLQLVERLFPELQRALPRMVQRQISTEHFVEQVEQHSPTVTWSENPLLVSLMAIIFFATGHLSESRAQLYQDIIEAILLTREHDTLSRDFLGRMLSALALWLHQYKGRSFTRQDLFTFHFEVLNKTWGEEVVEQTRHILQSGVLEPVGHDAYQFCHQTFQEYLAAAELARRLTSPNQVTRQEACDLAWSKRTYSRWTEVLRLMVGALVQDTDNLGQVEACRWIRSLLELRKTEEGDLGSLGLQLALTSVGELGKRVKGKHSSVVTMMEQTLSIWIEELFIAAWAGDKAKKHRLLGLAEGANQWPDYLQQKLIDWMVGSLRDRDANVRAIAVEILGQQGERVPLELLFSCLEDQDSTVRNAAEEALERQRTRVPLESLQILLENKDRYVRAAAVRMLGRRGEQVPLETFSVLLESDESIIRAAASQALAWQGERVSLEVLLTCLKDDNFWVREEVVEVLRQQGKRIPREILLALLEDENASVRTAAVEALGQQREQVSPSVLFTCLEDESIFVVIAAMRVLLQQEENSSEALFAYLEDRASFTKEAAIQVIGISHDPAHSEVLLGFLGDNVALVRKAAVEALGQQREWAPLVALLEDENASVRASVVEALGQQGKLIPLDPLLARLEDEHVLVRMATVKVLGQQGKRVPLEALLNRLEDKDDRVQICAAEALGQQGRRVPLEALLSHLEDKERVGREAVVRALGKQGELVPLDVLLACLDDENMAVRMEAIAALGRQKKRAPLEVFFACLKDENALIRAVAVKALGKQGERVSLDVLLACLDDEDWFVRHETIEVLGMQGKRIPLELLLARLEDEHKSVRVAAVEALGQQRERVPLEVLFTCLENEDWRVRWMAVKALKQQGKLIPLELLLARLEDEVVWVRIDAIKALGQQERSIPLDRIKNAIGDDFAEVRQAAIKVLATRSPEVLEPVMKEAIAVLHLQSPGPILGSLAHGFIAEIWGGMKYNSPMLFNTLKPLLNWHYWQVRVKAIRALGAIRRNIPDTIIKHLMELRHDPSPVVRKAAEDALAEILSLETGIEDD